MIFFSFLLKEVKLFYISSYVRLRLHVNLNHHEYDNFHLGFHTTISSSTELTFAGLIQLLLNVPLDGGDGANDAEDPGLNVVLHVCEEQGAE